MQSYLHGNRAIEAIRGKGHEARMKEKYPESKKEIMIKIAEDGLVKKIGLGIYNICRGIAKTTLGEDYTTLNRH